ncbi:carbohydrate ABC transporter permease [Cellulosilyticum lentocellum]|uniref:ABC-type transporter, integral membrane subunit n=1 Tax=Cellulosilyticum lentocellum (strain ATCC 49066 / DSM 5427 / NCIMB 11756 / RHM5) TaxID=642492 RepID=F2JRR4_CELLD|nr:sugar ABC transporter permease [Cellulosilyticum lentocellum]ADZ85094.1 ABC-type transporter, integral membrane subunit [Cellulosilyticum lentocellum DSM 5427]
MRQDKNSRIIIFTFLIIPVIHLLIFSYIPIFTNFYWSLTNYKGVGTPKFIGLKNYQRIFTDPQYLKVFKNCLWYMVVAIPQLIFAFGLAIVVNGKFRGLNVFKSILIIPYLLNGVIVSTIFIIFFNNSGTLNTLLAYIGIDGPQWLQQLNLVNPSIASISIWRYYGMNFIMFFGALQTIPSELYEAAAVDGCTKWQEIKYISIPFIKNVLFINILLSISGSIQVFEIPYIMMNGSNGTVTPVIQIQQSAFSDSRLGFAAALSVVVFFVVVLAVLLQNIVTKRGEE